MRGRAVKLSGPRRLVGDLMRFSIKIPRVAVQRQMQLGPLMQARADLDPKPSWTALFLKGYALLAQEVPELRRAYVKLPTPHLYEYPMSVAAITHERSYKGERAVLFSLVKGPEQQSIHRLGEILRNVRASPVLEVKEFRRALRLARAPAWIRRALMWAGLNVGRQRANYFGTFQLSVYSGLGAESLNPLTPLTTLLNYGTIGDDGSVCVRIHYDHRVVDGADVARALARFEEILNGPIADELKTPAGPAGDPERQREPNR